MEGVTNYVQAIYSFKGTNNDELCFKKGQVITITQREEGGWWEGTLDGKTGWFPSNYVTDYRTTQAPAATATTTGEASGSGQTSPSQPLPLPVDLAAQQRVYRGVVIRDLLESEKAHVAELRALVVNFLRPLKAADILTSDEYTKLTGNIEEVLVQHSQLITAMEEGGGEVGEGVRVGKLFLSSAPVVGECLTTYCANHPLAVALLETHREALGSFMESRGAHSPGLLVLTAGLSKPFRRLDKYQGLLQEVLRHLAEADPDRGDTQRAVIVYKELAASCSTARRQKQLQLEVLSGGVRGWEGEEVAALGEILHMGSVAVGPSHSDRYLVLFPRTLLVLAVSARMSGFIYQGKLPLSAIQVTKLEDSDIYKNAFEISGPMIETIVAACQTREDQAKWLELIEKQAVAVTQAPSPTPASLAHKEKPAASSNQQQAVSTMAVVPHHSTNRITSPISHTHSNISVSSPLTEPSYFPYQHLTEYFAKMIAAGVITHNLLKLLLYPEYLNPPNPLFPPAKMRLHRSEIKITPREQCFQSKWEGTVTLAIEIPPENNCKKHRSDTPAHFEQIQSPSSNMKKLQWVVNGKSLERNSQVSQVKVKVTSFIDDGRNISCDTGEGELVSVCDVGTQCDMDFIERMSQLVDEEYAFLGNSEEPEYLHNFSRNQSEAGISQDSNDDSDVLYFAGNLVMPTHGSENECSDMWVRICNQCGLGEVPLSKSSRRICDDCLASRCESRERCDGGPCNLEPVTSSNERNYINFQRINHCRPFSAQPFTTSLMSIPDNDSCYSLPALYSHDLTMCRQENLCDSSLLSSACIDLSSIHDFNHSMPYIQDGSFSCQLENISDASFEEYFAKAISLPSNENLAANVLLCDEHLPPQATSSSENAAARRKRWLRSHGRCRDQISNASQTESTERNHIEGNNSISQVLSSLPKSDDILLGSCQQRIRKLSVQHGSSSTTEPSVCSQSFDTLPRQQTVISVESRLKENSQATAEKSNDIKVVSTVRTQLKPSYSLDIPKKSINQNTRKVLSEGKSFVNTVPFNAHNNQSCTVEKRHPLLRSSKRVQDSQEDVHDPQPHHFVSCLVQKVGDARERLPVLEEQPRLADRRSQHSSSDSGLAISPTPYPSCACSQGAPSLPDLNSHCFNCSSRSKSCLCKQHCSDYDSMKSDVPRSATGYDFYSLLDGSDIHPFPSPDITQNNMLTSTNEPSNSPSNQHLYDNQSEPFYRSGLYAHWWLKAKFKLDSSCQRTTFPGQATTPCRLPPSPTCSLSGGSSIQQAGGSAVTTTPSTTPQGLTPSRPRLLSAGGLESLVSAPRPPAPSRPRHRNPRPHQPNKGQQEKR